MKALFKFLFVSCDEVSIYFVSIKEISKLHEDHFDDPTPTDCITFPVDDSYLGDVFICPEVAIQYANKKGLDPFQETLLYMVHATLHLLHFNDLTPKEKRCMRKKEKVCMDHLNEQTLKLQPK
jgi:probable rRNA maturation factor